MDWHSILFYAFSALLLFCGVMVISARNPVRGVLFLVLAFFASSVLWMMLQTEFLALTLIFVYVGAVMTLFLFIVMMLNIDMAAMREGFVRYLPLGLLLIALLVGIVLYALGAKHFALADATMKLQPADYSNVKALGHLLYTEYFYPFEIAAVILLVAIVAAISLAFRGRRNSKSQKISEQHAVRPEDRLKMVKMQAEKRN